MNYGTYYPGDSFWHQRDPRTKLMVLVVAALLVILEGRLGGQLFFFSLNLILFRTAHLPPVRAWKTVKAFRWLLLLTFLVNLVFNPPGVAILYFLRLLNLLLLSSWMLGTAEPLTLIQGIERLFHPLGRRLPVAEGAMVLGLSLSFFPLLIQEANEIAIAQRARGVTFKKQWWKRMTGLLAMVVPLFVNAIRRSLEVAQAMEVRGYRPGEPRGSLYELNWVAADTWSLLTTGALVACWLASRRLF